MTQDDVWRDFFFLFLHTLRCNIKIWLVLKKSSEIWCKLVTRGVEHKIRHSFQHFTYCRGSTAGNMQTYITLVQSHVASKCAKRNMISFSRSFYDVCFWCKKSKRGQDCDILSYFVYASATTLERLNVVNSASENSDLSWKCFRGGAEQDPYRET